MNLNEKIKLMEYDNKTTDEYILYQLLELAMVVTGRGDVSDDYTRFIEFPIGKVNIFSDSYYGNVQIDETDVDSAMIKMLINEVKERLLLFDKKISVMREQVATEVFDKPLKKMEGDF